VLEALADSEDERHTEMRDRLGEDFDPLVFDGQLKADVATLAKRWSRRPVAKEPRSA
jgi:hypothetical protein